VAKPIKTSLTKQQQDDAAWLIAGVVRDCMQAKRKPSLHEAKCRALTAANAYVAGIQPLSRAALPAAPGRKEAA
jgi:hypothetical protein